MGKREVVVRICDKCRKEVPAATTDKIMLNGWRYELDLCERHSEQFRDLIDSWVHLGALTGEPTMVEKLGNRGYRPEQERPVVPVAADGLVKQPAAVADPERMPRAVELPMTAQRWRLSSHAEERMLERQFTLQQVLHAAERPSLVTRSQKDENLEERTYEGCTAVVDPEDLTIVTVTIAPTRALASSG